MSIDNLSAQVMSLLSKPMLIMLSKHVRAVPKALAQAVVEPLREPSCKDGGGHRPFDRNATGQVSGA